MAVNDCFAHGTNRILASSTPFSNVPFARSLKQPPNCFIQIKNHVARVILDSFLWPSQIVLGVALIYTSASLVMRHVKRETFLTLETSKELCRRGESIMTAPFHRGIGIQARGSGRLGRRANPGANVVLNQIACGHRLGLGREDACLLMSVLERKPLFIPWHPPLSLPGMRSGPWNFRLVPDLGDRPMRKCITRQVR
jgi:hypothetical protein